MRIGKIVLLGTVLSLAAGPVLAQGRGNSGGANVGAGAAAGVNAGGVNAGVNAGGQSGVRFGGQSDASIGAQGRANTNGPNAADRAFGQDRAAQRPDRSEDTAAARTNGNSELGSLNAARASDNARANAASGSRVGEIGTYETQMRAALAISDPARRNAAITSARQQLAQTSNKPLTSDVVAQLDSTLSIQGASPQLGASQ